MFSLRVSCQRTGRPSSLGEAAEQQLLRVGADLGAEAAADVGRDDAAPASGSRPLRRGDGLVGAVRVLRRQPLVQPAVDPRRAPSRAPRAGTARRAG